MMAKRGKGVRRMRTSQLQYFLSVAEHLNFTKAAEACHVAQPAISQQIQALEKELGFALFARSTKGVELTEAGRQYYQDVSGVLRSLDKADRRAAAIAHGQAGMLSIGVASSGQTGMLKTIDLFRNAFPAVKIELHRVNSKTQHEQLRHGVYDILPTAPSNFIDKSDLGIARPSESKLKIAMSENHPLATKRSLAVADLVSFTHIMANCPAPDPILETYPYLADHPDTPVLFAEDQGIAWIMMNLGLGIEALPEAVIPSLHHGYVLRDVEGYDATLGMGWVYLSSNTNPALAKYLEFLDEQHL